MDFKFNLNKDSFYFVRHTFSAPFIYFIIVPIVFLDISLEVYHRISFPLYGLPYVDRWKYIQIDRHKLSYLNGREKLNCAYCGYVNGFLAYAVRVAGETEKYWCGIMHEKKKGFIPPAHHKDFVPYNNECAYKEKWERDLEREVQEAN